MKSKDLIVGVVVVAVAVVGLGIMSKASSAKKSVAKPALAQKAVSPSVKAVAAKASPVKAVPAKKIFSKDMGGLTVQVIDVKGKDLSLSVKAFKLVDSRSSVFVGYFNTNRMQELAPGTYDIELNTVPQKIYKGINVSKDRETVENLGCLTGILVVKMLDSKGKPAQAVIKVYQTKTAILAATTNANRPLELVSGIYDVEIGVMPKVVENAITIESGKEKVMDLGAITGSLFVKALDENRAEKKNARQSVKIKRSDTGEVVINTRVNIPAEIRPGAYTVEIGTVPPQVNKDVRVVSGAEAVVEVVIATPPPVAAQPAKVSVPTAAVPAKRK